jgi:hypothetical protein
MSVFFKEPQVRTTYSMPSLFREFLHFSMNPNTIAILHRNGRLRFVANQGVL